MMTSDEIDMLNSESDETLALYWAHLNSISTVGLSCPMDRVWSIMYYIRGKIGLRLCLKQFHTEREMSERQFNAWYDDISATLH